MDEKPAAEQIDNILRSASDWRGRKLAQLRTIILKADPAAIEEVKWKKPSRPEGVPVWSHDGILCTGEMLKSAVRLTFPKGAHIADPAMVFNTRLDSASVRAVDFHEEDTIDEGALRDIIAKAVAINATKAHA